MLVCDYCEKRIDADDPASYRKVELNGITGSGRPLNFDIHEACVTGWKQGVKDVKEPATP